MEEMPIATIIIDMLKKSIQRLYIGLIIMLILCVISTLDSFYQRGIIRNMVEECHKVEGICSEKCVCTKGSE